MSGFVHKTEKENQAGIAFVWVLMVLAITSALSLAFLQKVSVGTSAAATRSSAIKAQYLAEAAAGHALWRLINEDTFPENDNVYYMHALGGGRYGYKVRRHEDTTFAAVATVGGVENTVVHQSYVLYITDAWYDPAWQYRQKIIISEDIADTDLTDFPYLVKISDAGSGLFMNAQLDGDDILFTDSKSTTKLDHQIEKYTSIEGGEEFVAWVKLPVLNSSDPTDIYIYYGNHSASNQENSTAVWSNGYESVYHLHDDFADSVGNHAGTNFNSTDTIGPMADAQDFFPDDGYDMILLGNWDLGITNKLTLQAWIKSDDGFAQDDPRVLSKAVNTGEQDHVWMMSLYNGNINENRLRFRLKTGAADGIGTKTFLGSYPNGYLPDADQWYLVAMTYNGTQMRIIRDGLDGGSTTKAGNIRRNDWPIEIGKNPYSPSTTSVTWDGKIDEVRISTVARSIEWMRAEYRNQGSTATYQSLQDQQTKYVSATTLMENHFDTDAEGFVVLTDTFRGTAQPAYAAGSYISSGGYDGGALRVQLGGINDLAILGMSGGWRQTFTLAEAGSLTLSFVYKLSQAANYENDELSQTLVSVDGTLYGEGADDYVAQITGDGNGGSPIASGWRRFYIETGELGAGTHTLIIGGYNNKKTYNDESTEILIDDVIIKK